MSRFRILVAQRAGARLFDWAGPGSDLVPGDHIHHPAGRLRNQDLLSDGPGYAFDEGGQGRHAMDPPKEATEHEADAFAAALASRLREECLAKQYRHLILVAGPRFLGRLREALDDATARHIAGSIALNLNDIGDDELLAHLDEQLREIAKQARGTEESR